MLGIFPGSFDFLSQQARVAHAGDRHATNLDVNGSTFSVWVWLLTATKSCTARYSWKRMISRPPSDAHR